MNDILSDCPNIFYLDDFLVFSDNKKNYFKDLRVLQLIEAVDLIVKAKKCQFFKTSLDFRGHTIDQRTPNRQECVVV